MGIPVVAGAIAIVVVIAVTGGETGETAQPNSVAVIDVETNELVDGVPVGAEPTDVAATPGSVWVANTADDTVSEVDQASRTVEATIAPGIAVDAMAAGAGAVWASDNRRGLVARIDPTLSVVDRSIRIEGTNELFNRSTPLATGAGSVWAVTAGSAVAQIDPARGKVEAEVLVGSGPRGIATGEGGVWVADYTESTVTRINPNTSGVTATIPVGHGASGVAAGEGGVWVANTLDDAIVRIDPETNSATATIPVGSAPTGVAVGGGAVWAANSGSGTVSRIDPGTGRVTATIDVGERPQALAVADGEVWVSVQSAPPSPDSDTARLVLNRGEGAESQAQPTDPALYSLHSLPATYATTALLLNYPQRPFPEGARLEPEVAESMPQVSAGGRTYTFRLRDDFRFSPPSNRPVTAAAFERAIERSLDPRTGSYAAELVDDIVGWRVPGRSYPDIAGVTAQDDTLRIRLTAPSPSPRPACHAVLQRRAAEYPDRPRRDRGIPSAGPYYVAASDRAGGVVLQRNPNYVGDRPAEFSEIVVVPASEGVDVADVEAGRADALALTSDEQEDAGIEAEYGAQSEAARDGDQRFFSYPTNFVAYLALNTERPLLSSRQMRRAVNYAIDRPALARVPTGGAVSGQPMIKHPQGVRGFSDAQVYPLMARICPGEAIAAIGGRAVMYTCTEPRAAPGPTSSARPRGDRSGGRDQAVLLRGSGTTFRSHEPWDIADASWVGD